jgi:hypothetical protein
MATIWEARKAGWGISLRCHRQREGLKSVRPCQGELKVHLSTMIAILGPEVEVAELQRRLRCPVCGTDRVEVRVSQPPSPEAGKKDEEKPRRRMRQARSGETTLGTCRDPWVVFDCKKCGRRGEYRREHLIEEFGNTVSMPSLLEIFAKSRGCGFANPGASPYDASMMNGRQCLILYDVEGTS